MSKIKIRHWLGRITASRRLVRAVLVAAVFSLLLPLARAGRPPGLAGLEIASTSCEFAADPLGLDQPRPRLSWRLRSDERGQGQTAYQIQVTSGQDFSPGSKAEVWDSDRVESGQSVLVPYGGPPLNSRQRCAWRVRVWDKNGEASGYSRTRTWEMGLLAPEDWKAAWIGYTAGWPGRALYFRRTFEVKKTVRWARAYVAGLGYYELRINGAKVGNHVLDPGWTDYSKRVLYVTYDVGAQLKPGPNALGIIAGAGWYGQPAVKLQVELNYADGTREMIASEGGHTQVSWLVTGGPITRDSVYDGETYDARLEKKGWDQPWAPDAAPPANRLEDWTAAVRVEGPAGRLVAQALEPIRVVGLLPARRLSQPHPGIYVFDAGRNMAGWAELRTHGRRGSKIILRFAETLNPDGTVNQENLRTAQATDEYVLKGEGEETWEPRFTYHGFRYVQLEGGSGAADLGTLRFKMVRSDVAAIGSFACGDSLLNRIQRMVVTTEGSNLHSVPTDCPQRNERMGWLNDMTVRVEEAVYNFGLPRFYEKWSNDILDTQDEAGAITDTAPFKYGRRPADAICASYMLIAWFSYLHYGDVEVIRDHYASFHRWVDYLVSRSRDGIVTYSNWGDWSPPAAFAVPGSIGSGAISAGTPGELMSTGALYYQTRLLARMAGLIGRAGDVPDLDRLADRVFRAFNREYWDESAGGYGSNNQACNAFALYAGLVPPERRNRVVASLLRAVERNNWHLSTGNLCTKYLLEMLSEHGQNEAACRIADQRTYPGWGFMLENGATTLWERWEELTGGGMNSHDHPMMGSVSSWFYKYLGGIRADPEAPGFRHFIIRPMVVDKVGWVEASYDCPYGQIRSGWRKDGDGLRLEVVVPVNAGATVFVPAAADDEVYEGLQLAEKAPGVRFLTRADGACRFEVASGDYRFSVRRRGAGVATAVRVPAGDGRIRYMGRWSRTAGRAETVNSGSALLFHFRGLGLWAHFDTSALTDPPQIWVSFDGGDRVLKTVDVTWIELTAPGSAEGDHTVLLEVKDVSQNANRWTPPLQSGLLFEGFDLGAGGQPLDPAPALSGGWRDSAPRIAFFGDSITEGIRVLSMETGPEGADGTRTYAYLAGLALGANITQVGFGAQGVTQAGWGGVPPAGEAFAWDFAGAKAAAERFDVIVVNQGTNDGRVPAGVFEPAYRDYLRKIRSAHPTALVLAMRPFNGSQAGPIEAAVRQLGDPRIIYADTVGWLDTRNSADFTEQPVGVHPSLLGQAKAAKRIMAVLRVWDLGHGRSWPIGQAEPPHRFARQGH